GLAKALGSESGLTRSESIMGSPSYMAPEQAGGYAKRAGPAADIYSVGAILYELLTGRPPFRGATVLETLEQVKTAEPVPPSRLVLKLPRDIETICLKCLQRSRPSGTEAPRSWPKTCGVSRRPVQARPISKAERWWGWCRRNPARAGLTAAVAALMIIVAVGSTLSAVQFQGMNRTLESNLYFSNIALAHRELMVDNLGRAEELLDGCPARLDSGNGIPQAALPGQALTLEATRRASTCGLQPRRPALACQRGRDGRVARRRDGQGLLTLRSQGLCLQRGIPPRRPALASASADRTVKIGI
ncbi:MAG: protein kinase, partial [Singulisphaera sp.]